MKYLIFLFICVVSSLQLLSQATDTTNDLKNLYLKKSKSQKTTAWVLLGTGAAAITTGLIVSGTASNNDDINSGYDQLATGGVVAIIGTAACLSSIPFFIASAKNKRRAMAVTSGIQQIMMPVKGGWAYNMQPAIKIILPIGH